MSAPFVVPHKRVVIWDEHGRVRARSRDSDHSLPPGWSYVSVWIDSAERLAWYGSLPRLFIGWELEF